MNGDRVVSDPATAARLASEISAIFSAQSAMEKSADGAFHDWASADDMATNPKITALTEQRYAFTPPGVSPDEYAAYMADQNVHVAGELPAADGIPSTSVMSALLKGLP